MKKCGLQFFVIKQVVRAICGEINFLAKKNTYFTIKNKLGHLHDNTSAKINIVDNVYCTQIISLWILISWDFKVCLLLKETTSY